jgi:hypothetical protein
MPAKRKKPEQAIQRAVFDNIRCRGMPGVYAFHPANGGYRKPIEASILKSLGVVAGTPDVIIVHQGKCFAMELKAANGKMAESQIEAISRLQRAGAITAVCVGLDVALRTLEGWGILRGKAAGGQRWPA